MTSDEKPITSEEVLACVYKLVDEAIKNKKEEEMNKKLNEAYESGFQPRKVGRPVVNKSEEEYKEARKIYRRRYYMKNQAKIIETSISFAKNRTPEQREAVLKYQKEYYEKNKEKLRAKAKERRLKQSADK